jgi:hypothetical protein
MTGAYFRSGFGNSGMQFKTVIKVPQFGPFAAHSAEFRFEQPIPAIVQIRKTRDGSEIPPKIGEKPLCIATTPGEITPAETYADLWLAMSQPRPGNQINFGAISNQKRIELLAAVDSFFLPMRRLVESLVRILRWRGGDATAPLYPFLNIEEYLSTDGVT